MSDEVFLLVCSRTHYEAQVLLHGHMITGCSKCRASIAVGSMAIPITRKCEFICVECYKQVKSV